MTDTKNDGTRNREHAVGNDAELLMHNRAPEQQKQHTDAAGNYDPGAFVAAKTESESRCTQRQDDDEHLGVKMPLGKLTQKRCSYDQQRERNAMHYAQARQQNGCSVHHFGAS